MLGFFKKKKAPEDKVFCVPDDDMKWRIKYVAPKGYTYLACPLYGRQDTKEIYPDFPGQRKGFKTGLVAIRAHSKWLKFKSQEQIQL